jgi:Domain of unknown function (DUF4224)
MTGTELFLTDAEIFDLTKKTYGPPRVKALNALGIQHKVRGDGSIAILRDHIMKVFGGNMATQAKKPKNAEPNWGAI